MAELQVYDSDLTEPFIQITSENTEKGKNPLNLRRVKAKGHTIEKKIPKLIEMDKEQPLWPRIHDVLTSSLYMP